METKSSISLADWWERTRLPVLVLTTALIAWLLGTQILTSKDMPQARNQFALSEADLVLQASFYPAEKEDLIAKVLGSNRAAEAGLIQYQSIRKEVSNSQDILRKNLTEGKDNKDTRRQKILSNVLDRTVDRLDEIDIEIGLLQVKNNEVNRGISTWQKVVDRTNRRDLKKLAENSISLWQSGKSLNPREFLPSQRNIPAWFVFDTWQKFYSVNSDKKELLELQSKYTKLGKDARDRLINLLLSRAVFMLAGIATIAVGIVWLSWQILKTEYHDRVRVFREVITARKQGWNIPWDGLTAWQVIVFGFFAVSLFILPNLSGFLPILRTAQNPTQKAILVFVNYAIMAACGLAVMTSSIFQSVTTATTASPTETPVKTNFLTGISSRELFKLNFLSRWWLWGIGGYCVAIPIVLLVAAINAQIWQGNGGSNPLLELILNGHDRRALILYFITATIAAPFYEEILFRGFLLTSLTRYVNTWSAIVISGAIFAIAHLSLSEILPLMALGVILGYVYARSNSLLASMCVHTLWNGGTLLSLVFLAG
jgi:membrane protease YdiL (CAAX protease family)